MSNSNLKFINATQAFKDYGMPRSALRELSEDGVIQKHEKKLYGGKVMKLYSVKDIERYLNEQ